jgi:hypothetical protein
MGAIDLVSPFSRGIRMREAGRHLREDLDAAKLGMLDLRSLAAGYQRQVNPVQVTTTSLIRDSVEVDPRRLATDPKLFTEPVWDGKVWRDLAHSRDRRVVREVRRQHNIQWRAGRDRVMLPAMFGDAGAGLSGFTGNLTSIAGNVATDSGAGWPTATSAAGNAGLQGHIMVCGANASGTGSKVLGVIVANIATAATVDQWYAVPVTGAAGTTPNGTAGYCILPGGSGWLPWIALSTDTTAVAATGSEPAGATFTGEQTANGLGRAFVGQGGATAPIITPGTTTSTIALDHTWTYSTTGAVVLAKVLLYNSLSVTGNLISFETLLNATGTVSLSGDTLRVTWTMTVTTS